MSDTTLLLFLTLLIFISGSFLTSGWHKYLMTRRKRKEESRSTQH
jgi:hypothetical protein